MVRPAVVTFLDEMLRSDNRLRVEEVHVPEGFAARQLGDFITRSPDYIVLAVRAGQAWQFNPAPETLIAAGTTLVVMVNPEGRWALEKLVAA